jgi:hypothetical protein
MEYKEVTGKIIGCAYRVYTEIVKQLNREIVNTYVTGALLNKSGHSYIFPFFSASVFGGLRNGD